MAAWKFVPGLVVACVAAPVLAGELANGAAPAIPWLRIALAFFFCIALASAAILAMRKFRGADCGGIGLALRKPSPRAIEIVEARRVSQHGDVCLMRCHGRDYLFIVTPHQAMLLDKSAEGAE